MGWALNRSEGMYHVVTCSLDTEFQGDEVDVVVSNTLKPDGSSNSTSRVTHSALGADDTKRIMVQLEYICDGNILPLLKGSSTKASVFAKYHRYFMPVDAEDAGDAPLQALRD